MNGYALELELLSPTLAGSGESAGALIDADVVFDDVGLPYIPAKRIKGCLLDAARGVGSMFNTAGVQFPLRIDETFGRIGGREPGGIFFGNFHLPDYPSLRKWMEYLIRVDPYKHLVTPERIIETYTEIRNQTRIEADGTAADHTLRTIRVLKKGLTFLGDVRIETEGGAKEEMVATLALACMNFRSMGTKRNRGFGDIRCRLLKNGKEMDDLKLPEGLSCTN